MNKSDRIDSSYIGIVSRVNKSTKICKSIIDLQKQTFNFIRRGNISSFKRKIDFNRIYCARINFTTLIVIRDFTNES